MSSLAALLERARLNRERAAKCRDPLTRESFLLVASSYEMLADESEYANCLGLGRFTDTIH
jgi:hypothetical protein